MLSRRPKCGDIVVYRKVKHSVRPGPRAKNVHPAASGDDYSYYVDKFWRVTGIKDGQTLRLKTRGGKVHEVKIDNPLLRPAKFWELILWASRLPKLTDDADTQDMSGSAHSVPPSGSAV